MNGYMNQKQEHRPQGRQGRRYASSWCILGAGVLGRPNGERGAGRGTVTSRPSP